MKLTVLYRPKSEHARAVEVFVRELKDLSGREPELIDVDSKEGIRKVEVYDAMEYPSVMVTTDDGQLHRIWSGTPLPMVNDVLGSLSA